MRSLNDSAMEKASFLFQRPNVLFKREEENRSRYKLSLETFRVCMQKEAKEQKAFLGKRGNISLAFKRQKKEQSYQRKICAFHHVSDWATKMCALKKEFVLLVKHLCPG